MALLWYRITEETRRKLRALMPKSWQPPREDGRDGTVKGKIEDTEEIAKLMTQTRRSFKDD